MPTLHWIGKEKVLNHHQDVPYRILEHQYAFSADGGEQKGKETGSGNKIIHGDNLEALKALLPQYEGQVKCIYIDPPYNTGNENWVYNDNVNDPKIKKWLQKVVGKEGEDLSRHDKWLCMMYPRLKLLHKLLAEDGAVFISIDDNEQANLKLICNEIFGESNFITTIIWHKVDSPKNTAIHFSEDHDYILVYAKSASIWRPKKIARTDKMIARYKNPDNDLRGPWLLSDMAARNYYSLGLYSITTPSGRIIEGPPAGSFWRISREKYDELVADNRVWFGKNGSNRPGTKRFLSEVQAGVVPQTLWSWKEVGSTRNSKQELSKIMTAKTSEELFITPKPTGLIERIIQIASDEDSIILDSFAGSGTTGHAVLNLNKEGGNRKFIMIEMEQYVNSLTTERIKKVMEGNAEKKDNSDCFDFYSLGKPLFKEDKNLNEEVSEDKIREYIYYSETKQPLKIDSRAHKEDNEYLLDTFNDSAYYFFYQKDNLTTLDNEFLATITTVANQYIIYADNCLLDKAFMQTKSIIFKKIPRDITRF